jgi:LacI family transcriptional regulator
MATIKEVAKRAKVSVGTVSNVVSGSAPVSPKLRERVLKAIGDMDYEPNHVARSLKVRQTHMLGMVLSDITNPFFPQMVRGAEDAALSHGFLLVTFNTDDHLEREKQILSVLRTRRVDGILLVMSPNDGDWTHIRNTIAAGIPVVCLDRVPPRLSVDSVSTDNVSGAEMCVRHLISMGHSHIGIITGVSELQTARDRLKGYENALRGAGIPVEQDLIREGDFRMETGYRLGKGLLLGARRPSALFAANAMMGLGVVKAIEELGLRCPEDVAIAMFDDLPLAEALRPHLTAVAQPAYSIGFQGTELLIGRIEGRVTGRKPIAIRLEPELKVRESSLGPVSPGRSLEAGALNPRSV